MPVTKKCTRASYVHDMDLNEPAANALRSDLGEFHLYVAADFGDSVAGAPALL
jgi:hypothetical protein